MECRRVLMLSHFGEGSFTRAQCNGTCDNCNATAGQSLVQTDVSEAAKKGATHLCCALCAEAARRS